MGTRRQVVPASLHSELTEYSSLIRALHTNSTLDVTSHLLPSGWKGKERAADYEDDEDEDDKPKSRAKKPASKASNKPASKGSSAKPASKGKAPASPAKKPVSKGKKRVESDEEEEEDDEDYVNGEGIWTDEPEDEGFYGVDDDEL